MMRSNVHPCPHTIHSHTIRTSTGKTVVVCDACYKKIMLILSSKRVMDTFYTRNLTLEEQYKIRRERADRYAMSEVGMGM